MQKLISALTRLYLTAGTLAPQVLAQRLSGQAGAALTLTDANGLTRAIVIAFDKLPDSDEAQHWHALCASANALQAELGLPAPAVSISGGNGYALWLSLAAPMPVARVQQFLELLHGAYFPDVPLAPDAASAAVELPPCLRPDTGKWSAFIHPGMGASFADESGLEMAPPFAGQTGFLDGLRSITEAQFAHALHVLQQAHDSAPAAPAATTPLPAPAAAIPARAATPHGLLLRDATLEDIVQFLHAKNIEPTFRHLLPK